MTAAIPTWGDIMEYLRRVEEKQARDLERHAKAIEKWKRGREAKEQREWDEQNPDKPF